MTASLRTCKVADLGRNPQNHPRRQRAPRIWGPQPKDLSLFLLRGQTRRRSGACTTISKHPAAKGKSGTESAADSSALITVLKGGCAGTSPRRDLARRRNRDV